MKTAAPLAPDSSRRSHPLDKQCPQGISRQDGVNQFLDIFDDVVAVADRLDAFLKWHGNKMPARLERLVRETILNQSEELRAISRDIADICDEMIPGSPAARDYHFVAWLEPFEPPPLPGGSDQNNNVSRRLTPVSPEWRDGRQNAE